MNAPTVRFALVLILGLVVRAMGIDSTTAELRDRDLWVKAHLPDVKLTMSDVAVGPGGSQPRGSGELPTRERVSDAVPEPRHSPLPFSFVYGGRSSDRLLGSWRLSRTMAPLDPGRVRHTLTWSNRASGLEMT